MQTITAEQRRARLARRHAIAPGHRCADAVAATEAMTVLHATEPATVYLSLAARVEGLEVGDVDKALYVDRSLVKQLAMRRTLFVFPRELLPAAWGSAAARVAAQQRSQVAKDVERHGVAADGAAWLEAATGAVLGRLADGSTHSAAQLRETLPELAGRTVARPEKKWAIAAPFAPRVLTVLGAEGRIVRGDNAGHWRTSRPAWIRMDAWLGSVEQPLSEAAGYAELARRWLGSFGPGTEDDLVWWLGATRSAVRRALADVSAVEVQLDEGTGWVLPGDVDDVPPVEPWAALLPVLDPTTMGWKERAFYLDARHTAALFDRNGNAGTTAWWDGRIVGCWVQDDAGVVRLRLLEEVPRDGREALEAEAERLTRWLDGQRVSTVYSSPAMKG